MTRKYNKHTTEIKKTPVQDPSAPQLSLEDIIADLKGFGIEETSELISFGASGKQIQLRLSNIPTEEEIETLLAVEEYKGHAWVSRVKAEILSRAISWVNGIDLKGRKDEFVVDPTTNQEMALRVVIRNLIMGWGQEVVNILWKILMVHCQKIEDRLFESLPDSQVMTEVEKRFIGQALQEIQNAQQEVYKEAIKEIANTDRDS
jgi:hypothetical protein